MREKRVIYIGMYDYAGDPVQRFYSLAGINKMDYIIGVLNELGYGVDIISIAKSREKRFRLCKGEKLVFGQNTLSLPPTFGTRSKILKMVRVVFTDLWVVLKLLGKIKSSDTVIAYHTIEGMRPIRWLRQLKRFRLILEVEELYSEISSRSETKKQKEARYIHSADEHIVVSHYLKDKLKLGNAIVIYGNYQMDNTGAQTIGRKNDNVVRLLFSGSLDSKRGVRLAVETIMFLPDNYILNVCGTDSEDNVKILRKEIDKVNTALGRNACRYLGKLPNEQYKKLLQESDIALNPQADGSFAQYLFPSKILSYLRANLHVVSTKGESIVSSPFSPLIIFADDYSPQSVAKAIMAVAFIPHDNTAFLNEMHDKVKDDLSKLLKQ